MTVAPLPSVPAERKFFCDICKVGATSQPQLDMHLKGKSHAAKVQKQQQTLDGTAIVASELAAVAGKKRTAAAAASGGEEKAKNGGSAPSSAQKKDFSANRTPSGQYYCPACNSTLNSENQFEQHILSKKHKYKVATGPAGSNKSALIAKRRKLATVSAIKVV